MTLLAIAYSHEDLSAAQRIAQALEPGIELEHHAVGRANEGELLVDLLRKNRLPLLLLVSDSFLTNPNAVLRTEEVLRSDRPVLPVVIDAHRPEPGSGEIITVNTRLSDRSDVIHYLSHWQDRYIELRRGGEDYTDAVGQHGFRNYLRKIRETSVGIEEVLELLLARQPVTNEQLVSQDYADIYRFAKLTPPAPDKAAEDEPKPQPSTAEKSEMITDTNDTLQDHVQEWIDQAWEMSDAGNTKAALELLHHSLEHQPEEHELHYQYALMLALAAERLPAARREVDSLLDNDPHYPDGLFLSGELYLNAGDTRRARDDWERLSEVQQDYPELNQRLGSLLMDHFPEEGAEAAGYLRKAAKSAGASGDTLYRYAVLLEDVQQQPDMAIKTLYSATKQDPNHAPAHYRLAVSQFRRGARAEARKHFQRAVALEPIYDTPANRAAFAVAEPPVQNQTNTPAPVQKQPLASDALDALKRNIAELEEMMAQRENPAPASAPGSGSGKTVFLTGATSGIGLATARRLAREGYRMIIAARRTERLEDLAEELRDAHGTDTHLLTLDVAERRGVGEAIDGLPEKWRDIDLLINNAGKAKGFDPIQEGNLDHWDEMIDVNLRGLLYVTRAVTPGMVARKSGTVINVCSTAGKEVYPNGNVYCATKHAVDALTYAMRLDLVKHGIRVGQICPAHVEETEFAVVRFDGDRERAKIYDDFQPLRSQDVAEAIHFMVSQPPHVNIMDVVLQGTQQASSTVVDRSGRDRFAPKEEE